MLGNDKTQLWVHIPIPLKERLEQLSQVNPTEYSMSRLGWACIEREIEQLAQKVQKLEPLGLVEPITSHQPGLRFKSPAQGAQSRRKR